METIGHIVNDRMANYSNKYKFDFEKMLPSLITPEGSVKMVSKNNWPILENSKLKNNKIYK